MTMRLFDFGNWPATVPSPVAEAGNGAIWPVLALVLLGLGAYIIECWRIVRFDYEPIFALRPICATYVARKAAIALFVGIGGFDLRTFSIWLPRHLENRGTNAHDVLPQGLMIALYLIGTVMVLVGFTCWLRVTFPLGISQLKVRIGAAAFHLGQLVHPGVILLCFAWAVWMAS